MSEEDHNTVLYEVSDRIATVTLNRPEALNAIIDQLASEFYDVMQTAASDRKVRAIVLTGAGRAFCAGGDITGFGNQTPKDLITKLLRQFDMNRRPDFQTRHTYFPAIPKPIIGMINGAAAGFGLLYSLFCDIRFASEDAVLTTAFARRGLGAEYGMAWILTELVGQANALDLLISGRKDQGTESAEARPRQPGPSSGRACVSHLCLHEGNRNLVRTELDADDEAGRLRGSIPEPA